MNLFTTVFAKLRVISSFHTLTLSRLFLGVADGVGGWRHYGIDPGEFSSFLMRTCERLVSMGRFTPSEPAGLLARSYYELLESKQPILGIKNNLRPAFYILLVKRTSLRKNEKLFW